MEMKDAIDALAALAHRHRLAVFRLLIREGPGGSPAGTIARALGLVPSTLSHHLAALERAGLLRSTRVDRRILYAVDIEGTRRLLAFLTEDCCQGRPALRGDTFDSLCQDENAMPSSSETVFNVLFLCTGNSARSILAEAILDRLARGRFRAHSAGSHPAGRVNPHALDLLKRLNYPTAGLRSKSWDEFATTDAAPLDFVFTVCDNAAGEVCPIWPGQPMTAHWAVPDPAAVEGTPAEIAAAFADTYRMLERRIDVFINLPLRSLDRLSLQRRLDDIGRARQDAD